MRGDETHRCEIPQRSEQEWTRQEVEKLQCMFATTPGLITKVQGALAAAHQAGWHEGRQYEVEYGKLNEQLLCALAAIDKAQQIIKTAPKDWFFEHNRRASHALNNIFESLDRAALDLHDAEVRKPLVDALEKIKVQLDMEPQRLPLVERLQKYIADALAKVKE